LQLSEISNQGFRNLSSDAVFFGTGVTLITGENAQGKTNLLEAVALVCGQRSFRGASPADMAGDRASFSIGARIEGRSGPERLSVRWSKDSGREFLRDGKAAGFREISQAAPAVFLAPEHRELLTGSPSVRRRFLDRLVLGLKPAAGDDLSRYATALSERNALLSRARHGRETISAAPGELEAWTEELAVAGSAVRRRRREALAVWQRHLAELLPAQGVSGRIAAAYSADGDSVDALRAACERLLPLERRRGYSMAGPHRDDLVFSRGGRALAMQASAGEIARITALIKLAEWSAVAGESGQTPLFAADDFDAGLSPAWAEEFFDALPGEACVLLTTAAPPARFTRRAAAVFEVREGCVSAPRALRAVKA
jgi:DNA replication and repair protein RecF